MSCVAVRRRRTPAPRRASRRRFCPAHLTMASCPPCCAAAGPTGRSCSPRGSSSRAPSPLLAAGTLYTDAVTLAGLHRELREAPADRSRRHRPDADPPGAAGGRGRGDRAGAPARARADRRRPRRATSAPPRSPMPPTDPSTVDELLVFAAFDGIRDHGTLADGRWPEPGKHPVEVAVSTRRRRTLGVTTGDTLDLVGRLDGAPVAGRGHRAPGSRTRATRTGWATRSSSTGTETGGSFTIVGPLVADRRGRHRAARREPPARRALARRPGGRGLPPETLDAVATSRSRPCRPDQRRAPGHEPGARSPPGCPEILASVDRSVLVAQAGILLLLVQFGVLAGYAVILVAALLLERRRTETALLRARGGGLGHLVRMALVEARRSSSSRPCSPRRGSRRCSSPRSASTPRSRAWASRRRSRGPRRSAVAIGVGAPRGPRAHDPDARLRRAASPGVRAAVGPPGRADAAPAPRARPRARRARRDRARSSSGCTARRSRGPPAASLGVDPLLVAAPAIGLLAGAVLAIRIVPRLAELAERVLGRGRGLVPALGGPPGRPPAAPLHARRPAARARGGARHVRVGPRRDLDDEPGRPGRRSPRAPTSASSRRTARRSRTGRSGEALRALPGVTGATPVVEGGVSLGHGGPRRDAARRRRRRPSRTSSGCGRARRATRRSRRCGPWPRTATAGRRAPGIPIPEETRRLSVPLDAAFAAARGLRADHRRATRGSGVRASSSTPTAGWRGSRARRSRRRRRARARRSRSRAPTAPAALRRPLRLIGARRRRLGRRAARHASPAARSPSTALATSPDDDRRHLDRDADRGARRTVDRRRARSRRASRTTRADPGVLEIAGPPGPRRDRAGRLQLAGDDAAGRPGRRQRRRSSTSRARGRRHASTRRVVGVPVELRAPRARRRAARRRRRPSRWWSPTAPRSTSPGSPAARRSRRRASGGSPPSPGASGTIAATLVAAAVRRAGRRGPDAVAGRARRRPAGARGHRDPRPRVDRRARVRRDRLPRERPPSRRQERLGEFALLKALGVAPRQLLTWLTAEGAALLFVGLVAGVGARARARLARAAVRDADRVGRAAGARRRSSSCRPRPRSRPLVLAVALAARDGRARRPAAARAPGPARSSARGTSSHGLDARLALRRLRYGPRARRSASCVLVLVTALLAALAPRVLASLADGAVRGAVDGGAGRRPQHRAARDRDRRPAPGRRPARAGPRGRRATGSARSRSASSALIDEPDAVIETAPVPADQADDRPRLRPAPDPGGDRRPHPLRRGPHAHGRGRRRATTSGPRRSTTSRSTRRAVARRDGAGGSGCAVGDEIAAARRPGRSAARAGPSTTSTRTRRITGIYEALDAAESTYWFGDPLPLHPVIRALSLEVQMLDAALLVDPARVPAADRGGPEDRPAARVPVADAPRHGRGSRRGSAPALATAFRRLNVLYPSANVTARQRHRPADRHAADPRRVPGVVDGGASRSSR